MHWIDGIVLGIIQGLTEYLPVSSSGHLAVAGTLFGLEGKDNLAFAVLVHTATILSTVVVLRKEITGLLKGLFSFRRNNETMMAGKLLLSMVPVAIVGLFFKDTVEVFFGNGLFPVSLMLMLTAAVLLVSILSKNTGKSDISFRDALIIGLAQACAVLPGLSRSASTIVTGLLLGNEREKVAKFSFLMVILPVAGEAILDLAKVIKAGDITVFSSMPAGMMIGGFLAAFISGVLACRWMIELVKRGKLLYFSIYCLLLGLFVFFYWYFKL